MLLYIPLTRRELQIGYICRKKQFFLIFFRAIDLYPVNLGGMPKILRNPVDPVR